METRNRSEYFRLYNAERKDAIRKYWLDHREQINLSQRERRLKNPERFRAYDRKRYPKRYLKKPKKTLDGRRANKKSRLLIWRSVNRHRIQVSQLNWRRKNRVQEITRARSYRLNHPEMTRESVRKYNATNPEKAKFRCQKRRAILNGSAIGNSTVIESWEKRWKSAKRARCFWCLSLVATASCHTDHIVPLRLKGPHSIENLCISCGACNQRKHSKSLSEWNSQIREPALL